MWANDFPHSESTRPRSQALLDEHTRGLSEQERNRIVHDNVAELYHLSISAPARRARGADRFRVPSTDAAFSTRLSRLIRFS
jgi:hypothetical protein